MVTHRHGLIVGGQFSILTEKNMSYHSSNDLPTMQDTIMGFPQEVVDCCVIPVFLRYQQSARPTVGNCCI